MTLKKVAHTYLSNEQIEAMSRTVLSNTISLESNENIKNLRAALTKPMLEYDDAALRDRKSKFTPLINSLNVQRKDIITALRSHLTACIDQFMINKSKTEHAKIVQELVSKLSPQVTTMGYQEISTQIHTLISGSKSIYPAIVGSESAPLFSALDSIQGQFDVQWDLKLKSGEFNDAPRQMRLITKDIVVAVNKIFDFINTVADFDPKVYEPVVTALNAMVETYTTNIEASKTRTESAKKNKKKENDDTKSSS